MKFCLLFSISNQTYLEPPIHCDFSFKHFWLSKGNRFSFPLKGPIILTVNDLSSYDFKGFDGLVLFFDELVVALFVKLTNSEPKRK